MPVALLLLLNILPLLLLSLSLLDKSILLFPRSVFLEGLLLKLQDTKRKITQAQDPTRTFSSEWSQVKVLERKVPQGNYQANDPKASKRNLLSERVQAKFPERKLQSDSSQ